MTEISQHGISEIQTFKRVWIRQDGTKYESITIFLKDSEGKELLEVNAFSADLFRDAGITITKKKQRVVKLSH